MRLKNFLQDIHLRAIIAALVVAVIAPATAFATPKLVVQIVVSQMRYDVLERFESNFGSSGFKSFSTDGMVFTNARYGYMLTTTQAGLATIATGANPSIHGITGDYWINPTNGSREFMFADSRVRGLGSDAGSGRYSHANLDISALGDKLSQSDSLSKVISIALDPASAVIAGSASAQTYWLDNGRGSWISSTAYFDALKPWVADYNDKGHSSLYAEIDWTPRLPLTSYKNTQTHIYERRLIRTASFSNAKFTELFDKTYTQSQDRRSRPSGKWVDYSTKIYTPVGNKLVVDFASRAIDEEQLGKDEHTDLLTICFDSPRYISEMFGPESVELEDCYYQLDRDLGQLLQYIFGQFDKEDVVVMLSSDHGSSQSIVDQDKFFDPARYMMLVNAFLSAQYEPGNWVIDYNNRQLYLNRTLIYKYGFSLEEVQNKVASFSLQYRGISHAISSTSLQNGYFGSGYAAAIYNSFYPRRAGDLTINLMSGWIEKTDTKRSVSGSHYEYDTHVPLMFRGGRMRGGATVNQEVDMTSIAPTLARIMGIEIPDASVTDRIDAITNLYQ